MAIGPRPATWTKMEGKSQQSKSLLRKTYRKYQKHKEAKTMSEKEVKDILNRIKAIAVKNNVNLEQVDINKIFRTTMGHYFEYCVFSAISTAARYLNTNSLTVTQASAYLRNFSSKDIQYTQGGGTAADQSVTKLFGLLRTKEAQADPAFKTILMEAMRIVRECSAGVIRSFIANKVALLGKDITVSLITDEGGKGNPIGDLLLTVGGQRFLCELKWQEDPQLRKTPIKNFTGVGDKRFFGDYPFQSFLRDNQEEYWNYTQSNRAWIRQLTETALMEHLIGRSRSEDPYAVASYILQKGEIANEFLKESNTTVSELDKVMIRLDNSSALIDIKDMKLSKAKTSKNLLSLGWAGHKIIIYAQLYTGKVPFIQFWPDNFNSLKEIQKKDIRSKGPEGYSFTFSAKLHQEAFDLLTDAI